MIRDRRWAVLAVGACLGLSACGSGGGVVAPVAPAPTRATPTVSLPSTPAGIDTTATLPTSVSLPGAPPTGQTSSAYLGRSNGSVIYLKWVRDGDTLTGSLLQARVPSAGSSGGLVRAHASFSGSVSGTQVNLKLNGGQVITGTLSGSTLALDLPRADGGTGRVSFSEGTHADYQQAIDDLQGQLPATSTGATGSSGSGNAAADAEVVTSDLTDLRGLVAGGASTTGVTDDLAHESSDLAQTQADMNTVLGEATSAGPDNICADADTVQSDVIEVSADRDTVKGDVDSINSSASAIQAAIATLQRDEATLQSDEQADPASAPGGAPLPGEVQQAIADAQAAATAPSGALSTAHSLLQQAHAAQARSDAACRAARGGLTAPAGAGAAQSGGPTG
jgi:hypothetical protein